MDTTEEFLKRGVANIIPSIEELLKRLQKPEKLNVYFGIDPTSTKIHLGHAVSLRKLNEFAKLGHNVTFLIGDFTALIGDNSDKDAERPSLTSKEIEENFKAYKKQAEKVLDFLKVKIRYNSEWLKKLTFEEIVKLTQHFSTGDFTSRELVKKRLSEGKKVGLHEFLYPVIQGYDSFILDTDLQIGGTDQTFNMQAGRTLIKDLRKGKESFVLATPILEGPDGRKMSKSYGNAIWLDDNPNDMYAKVMAINDDLIIQYFTLATNLPLDNILDYEKKIKTENPINIKKELAHLIVNELHDKKAADEAQGNFESTVQNKELPEVINIFPVENFNQTIFEITSDWAGMSNSELKRLIQENGVEVDGEKISMEEANKKIKAGMIIKIGKRRVVKISSK